MWKRDDSETEKLCKAALQSFHTGRITPLLKEELKYHIQCRRMSEGKDELILDNEARTDETQPLRPDEVQKIQKRREQNRKASEKFRNKKKTELRCLEQLCRELLDKNTALKKEVENLEQKRDQIYNEVSDILQAKSTFSTSDMVS